MPDAKRRKVKILTKKREAQVLAARDRWVEAGLSTEPADRPRAEAAVRALYRRFGKLEPSTIKWVDSPGALDRQIRGTTRLVYTIDEWEDSFGFIGPSRVDWDPMTEVSDASWELVDRVYAETWDAAWRVGVMVQNQFFRNKSGNEDRRTFHSFAIDYGQSSVFQLLALECWRDVFGFRDDTDDESEIMEIAKSAGWWACGPDTVILSERYSRINQDPDGLLHCHDGPAIVYPDGWGVYAVHGVQVPKKVVMTPEDQELSEISTEENLEVRRIRIERCAGRDAGPEAGWKRYLQEMNARVLDQRRNDAEATTETLVATIQHTVLLCACPSTGRIYALEVSPEVETCEQAQAWLSGGLASRIISAA